MPLDSIQVAKDTAAINNNSDFQSKPIQATPDYQTFDVPSAPQKSSQNSIADLLLKIPDNVSKDTKNYANTTENFNRNTVSNRYPQYFLGKDNEDLNAELQSTPQIWGQGIMQFTQKVPAFLGQTLGLIGGGLAAAVKGTVNIGNEIGGGSGKVFNGGNAVTDMTDNWLTTASTNWHDSLADKYPIYKPEGYQESSIWHKLGTSEWWADDGMDRFALGVATMLPFAGEALASAKLGISPLLFGAAETEEGIQATGVISKMLQNSPKFLSSLGKEASSTLAKDAAIQAGEDAIASEAGIPSATSSITPERNFNNWVKGLSITEKVMVGGVSQSGLNAREAQFSISDKLKEQREQGYNSLSDDEIKDIAANGAKQAFWLTMPLAVATSALEMPMWFSSMKMAKSAFEKIGEALSEETVEKQLTALGEAVSKTVKPSLIQLGKKAVLQGIEHGPISENLQVAIGRYLDDRIAGSIKDGKLVKKDGNEESIFDTLSNYKNGIIKNWIDDFVNDPNGQNNVALGFFQGLISTIGGHYASMYKGDYKEQDKKDTQYINNLKSALVERRFFSTPENFYEKDEKGNVILENGKPKPNNFLIGNMGASLFNQTVQSVINKQNAIDSGDQIAFDHENYKSLASLFYNFASDYKGIEHINNILSFEKNVERQNGDRQNDVVNGIEMTPQMQYEKNIEHIQQLKKAYDNIEKYHNDISLLNVDKTNKPELKSAIDYVDSQKFTLYKAASDQIFFKDRLASTNAKLIELELLHGEGQRKEISSPEDQQINDLYKEKAQLEIGLKNAKDIYSNVASKENFISAYESKWKSFQEDANLKAEGKKTETEKQQQEEEKDLNTKQPFFTNKDGVKENFIPGREYEIPEDSKATVKDISDTVSNEETGELIPKFQIIDHNGNQLEQDFDTKEKAQDAADKFNENLNSIKKVKIIGFNDDGTIRIEDNTGKRSNVSPNLFDGYSKVETEQDKIDKESEKIEKAQSVAQSTSSQTQTNSPETDEQEIKSSLWESAKKTLKHLFFSTTSTSTKDDREAGIEALPHQTRSREFLNNIDLFPNRSKLKIILISPKQAISIPSKEGNINLSDLFTQSFSSIAGQQLSDAEKNDTLLAVYVQKDGETHSFVDKNGKPTTDTKEMIFETMPVPKTLDSKQRAKYRNTEKESDVNEQVELAKQFRINEFAKDKSSSVESYDFTTSNGFPIISEIPEKNSIFKIFKLPKESLQKQSLIQIATTNTITDDNGNNIKVPNGRPFFIKGSTIVPLLNRTFNSDEAETIYNVFKELANGVSEQLRNNTKDLKFNPQYSEYLNNVLFWTKSITSGQNAFTIKGGTLYLGGVKDKSNSALAIPLTQIEEFKDEIIKRLKETYSNIHNDNVKNISKPFQEFYLDNNELKTRKWKNYQSYLLSEKYPDGTDRSIANTPLYSNISAPSDSVPYSFEQKYSILQGIDAIPQQAPIKAKEETPTQEKPLSTQKIGEYTIGQENKFKTSKGEIPFIPSIDENGKISVELNIKEDDVASQKILSDIIASGTDGNKLALVISAKLQQIKNTEDKQPIVETPTPEIKKGFNPDNITPRQSDIPDARMVGKDGKERITQEDLDILKQWHQDNVPNLPYEVLENIYTLHNGEKAWGVFEDGVAKFYKHALKGTEYHEIFEGVFKGFLNEQQRQNLLDEFKSKQGTFIDRETGKKINYSDATDRQAKERIADDFADFRIGKLPAKTLGEKVLKFFKNIIEFFKSFVNKPSLKEKLFNDLNEGKFKESKLSISPQQNEFTETRAVENLTEQQTHEFIQDMTVMAGGIIFGENKNSLYNIQKLTSANIFNRIKNDYEQRGVLNELGEKAWQELVKRTKENLRSTIGVKFNADDNVDVNSENKNQNEYIKDAFTTDFKKTSKFAVKFLLSTLPKTVATNQQNSSILSLPQRAITSIKGYELVNFSKVFATLLDKTSNNNTISNIVSKLYDISKSDSDFVRLFKRLGGNLETGVLDYSNFNKTDWRLLVDFFQTFGKQKPDSFIQYQKFGQFYIAPANLRTNISLLKREWMENIKALSSKETSLISYNKENKEYVVDSESIKTYPIKNAPQQLAFLNTLGIEFSQEAFNKLSQEEKMTFAKQISAIQQQLSTKESLGSIKNGFSFIESRINTLANLIIKTTNPNIDTTFRNLDGDRMQSYSENNVPSIFENEFNNAKTLKELKETRLELNDVFCTNSIILKTDGDFFDENGNKIKDIKISHILGTLNEDGKGTSTSSLSLKARFVQELNQNLEGRYNILIPADSSTEWMINLGNHISYTDVRDGYANSKINKIFEGYLKDDVLLALDADNRVELKNTEKNAKELRFFKDILSPEILKEINVMIKNGETFDNIEKHIKNNQEQIHKDIQEYIEENAQQLKQDLLDNLILYNSVPKENEESLYKTFDLLESFTNEAKINSQSITEKEISNVTKFLRTNYIINNIELHKILFGDPFQFGIKSKDGKVILDETKRIKSSLSPRKTTFDSTEFNNFHNEEYNKDSEGNPIPLTDVNNNPFPGAHLFKPYQNATVLADVNIVGSIAMNDSIKKEIKKAYENTNEADAASIIIDCAYRSVKLRNGQWDDDAEAWHQWQMAYTRQALAKKGMFSYEGNEKTEEADKKLLKTKEPKFKTEILKPIVTGNNYGISYWNQSLHKMSQMPLYYKAVEGTNLENLYIKMLQENKDYVVMESGAKVGIEQMHPLYIDGQFNNTPFNNNIQIPWKAYGIQVENSYNDNGGEVTSGSQITKVSSMDLFNNGEASEDAKLEYNRNKELLEKIITNGYKEFINKLGIIDNGDSFTIEDNKKLSESLEYEMLRREVSQNVKDTIQTDENNQFIIPFEASPAYQQIRSIIYSMVNKSIVQRNTSGGAYVQAPATLWEDSSKGRKIALKTENGYRSINKEEYKQLSDEEKKKVVLTDDTLKFYTEDDPYCEILLPSWFKEKLSGRLKNLSDEELLNYLNKTEEGKSILSGIGFRIPTQALSSIEVFRVKGFLPASMGKTVVVPSEITTKAGSDFDIDKLNLYLKSIYIDKNNEIRVVSLKETEQATKDFYSKVFDDVTENKKINKAELFEAAQILEYGLDDPKELVEKYSSLLDTILEKEDISDYSDRLMKELETYNDKTFQQQLKEKFVNEMYKKALQNEYYDSLSKLLTLPENFNKLITPVDDGGLKKLSENLDTLRSDNESSIKNRMLNGSYLTKLRHAFITGKKWVGIAAVNITGHANAQKTILYIDKNKLLSAPLQDAKYLKDGEIVLPHNKALINGQEVSSMSGTKTANSKAYISDRLSGYATSFVDVAKDPYILKIIKSNHLIGTFMFLERIGCGDIGIKFLNQPIIDEYVKTLDNLSKKSLFDSTIIDNIKQKFPAEKNVIEKYTQTDKPSLSSEHVEESSLDNNIKKYYNKEELTSDENAIQQFILDEFLKYAKMAEYSFALTQATNYDTTRFTSSELLFQKQLRTASALNQNIFGNIDKLLSNTFVGHQAEVLDVAMDSISAIFKLETPEFSNITNSVLTPYATNKYLSKDKFQTIANKVKASFLDYIIQTKTNITQDINRLMVNPNTSVVTQLALAKEKYPQIKILQELQAESSDLAEGAKSIRLKANLKSPYDENLYTGMMRELRDTKETNSLYNDIVSLAILQGTYQSPISINNIIPIEDYSKIVRKSLDTLVATEDVAEFANGKFQRNNWNDDDIFTTFTPYAVKLDEYPKYFTHLDEPLFEYRFPSFLNAKSLSVQSTDRRILGINEAYNQYYTTKDYLKVPRLVLDRNEQSYVDLITGNTIPFSEISRKRAKGDRSIDQVFGYERVRYEDGLPLLNVDKDGNTIHIYKLINLLGESPYATEHYIDNPPSQFQNGTIKITNEIPNSEIVKAYGGEKPIANIPISEDNMDIPQYDTIQASPSLITWQLGTYEGQPQKEGAQTEIDNKLINTPNEPIGGKESFNEFAKRILDITQTTIDTAPANTSILTHNAAFGLIKIWDKEGRPDVLSKDPSSQTAIKEFRTRYTQQDANTGETFTIEGKNGLIHIIRHGETTDNVNKVFRQKDTKLTEKGIEEAKQLGKQFSNISIPQIISSALPRAIHTANLIMAEQNIANKKEEFPDKKIDILDKC